MRVSIIPLMVLALLCGAPGAEADETQVHVERRDGRVTTGSLSVMKNQRIYLETARGSVDVPLADLISVTAAVPPRPRDFADGETADVIFLASDRGGDSPGGARGVDALFGRIVAGDEFGVTIALEGGPHVELAFELIDRVLPRMTAPADQLARLRGAGFDDRVWRRQKDGGLDGLAGIVDVITGDVVRVESTVGDVAFDVAEVLAIVLAEPEAEEVSDGAGPKVVLRLAGGSRFAARVVRAGDGELVVSTRFADEVTLPLNQLSSLVLDDGRVRPIASLEPIESKERPTLGGSDDVLHPWRRHWSVTGQVLSVAGVGRATGLGVHANADLTFAVPDGANAFRVTAGLCDEVGTIPATGTVVFTVLVDGEERARSPLITEGDGPVMLRVERLSGSAEITLRVDDGGDDDAGDRAAWVDGVFLIGG